MSKPQRDDSLFCPEVAFDPGCPELTPAPSPYPQFKIWSAENVGTYAKCKVSYDTLKQCWVREASKRSDLQKPKDDN